MTVEQAAKRLRIGRNQAYESVNRGEIPHVRMGKRILVLKEPLERMLRGEIPKTASR
ncbi:MAG: helix-turn-helix domain-containing protein [Enhydrobacter sp.]|nr:helix-turn-helix domain-containing protein [Enhydrobacter sp.]